MFSRASPTSAICLRCHSRLTGRLRTWKHATRSSCAPSVGRWQSTAALKIDEDSTAHSSNPAVDEELAPRILSKPDRPKEDAAPNDDPLQTGTKYRRWRPHQAETLGLNVLGKPAEVLIIPTRKRKIVSSPPENLESDGNGALQQSLDSELRPVSMKEVLQNIDSLKNDLGQTRSLFSTEEWNERKKRLGNGFTRMQLQEYLRIAAGKSETDPKETYLPSDNQKRSMAAKIMSEAWQWSCHDKVEATNAVVPELVKKNMAVNASKLEYIMLHKKQQLGLISEGTAAQIDVFKKKSRIQIGGSNTAVASATAKLTQLLKSVQQSSVRIPTNLRASLADDAKAHKLTAALMQKHKLLIQRTGETFTIIGPTKANPNVVIRDLAMLTDTPSQLIRYTMGVASKQESYTEVPMYPNDLPQWLQNPNGWYRHISSEVGLDVESSSVKAGSREARTSVEKLLKAEQPNQKKLSRFKIARGTLDHEYTAELGQAMFRSDSSKIGNTGTATAEILFALQPAMLAQVLGRKEFTSIDVHDNAIVKDAADDLRHPMLLHLRLRPLRQNPRSPPIEIFLSGEDVNLGLRQQLQIRRMFAVLDQWRHAVLLPHQPLDILLKRTSKIDFLGDASGKPSEDYLGILRQVGSYLEQAQSSSRVQLPYIWNLDISSLLANKAVNVGGKDGVKVSTKSSDDSSALLQDTSSTTNAASTQATPYIMEPPEYLDVTSYASAMFGDAFIDHIFCKTSVVDRARQRQILRITANSLSSLLSDRTSKPKHNTNNTLERQRRFKKSVAASYEFAAMLDDAAKNIGNRSGLPESRYM